MKPFAISGISIISQLQNDISHMKTTLNKIAKEVGVVDTTAENIDNEVKNFILEGKRIKAIKEYRILTGAGLKEAKDYVDSLDEDIIK